MTAHPGFCFGPGAIIVGDTVNLARGEGFFKRESEKKFIFVHTAASSSRRSGARGPVSSDFFGNTAKNAFFRLIIVPREVILFR